MAPKFSVIIPAYNSASILGRAINSVLSQTFTSWEIIVVDDGSTDNTREITLSYPQIKYYCQENQGVSAARNYGSSLAQGNWLIFLDSDDALLPESLDFFIKSILTDTSIDVWVSGYELLKNGKIELIIPSKGRYHPRLAGGFSIRKSLFDQLGGYDTKLKFAENTELFHRISLTQAKEGSIQKASVKYFVNLKGGSKNLQNTVDSISWILEKHHNTLTPHVKFLYHQILGVIFIRFRNFPKARFHLFQAFKIKPYKVTTFLRLVISFLPMLAIRFYKEKVH